MSKRHHVNRRRTYGRRQHELRERRGRVLVDDFVADAADLTGPVALGALDAGRVERGARMRGAGYLGGE